ncbi:MAG: hypothetical protein NDJ90_12430 [Oligoflexia bacterium]|nr:hypothetical protein [Oligoflexia bacterium]
MRAHTGYRLVFLALVTSLLGACQQTYTTRLVKPTRQALQVELSSGTLEFRTTFTGNLVWIVTRSPFHVYLVSLDGAPTKTWNLPSTGSGGTRTYFSEIGLLMARPGELFRISEDVPEGTTLAPIWKATGALADARTCVTSFRHSNKTWVGIAWNKADRRAFTRIPIDLSKPEKIDVSRAETKDLPAPALWGYGCYTDQTRGYLWSNYYGKTYIAGVNFRTMEDAAITAAPNYGITNTSLGAYSNDLKIAPAAYAISGDAKGNVLAGSAYTYAHEAKNDVIFWSKAGNLLAARAECFTSPSMDCSAGSARVQVNSTALGSIGPMGSLQDGRVIAITRGNPAKVFLLSLANPADLSAGVDIELIATLEGDAYMYNDFTGSTLYARDTSLSVDLSTLAGYDSSRPVTSLSFSWKALGGGAEPWQGFTLQARCLGAEGSPAPAFENVTGIQSSQSQTQITAASCRSSGITRVELKAVPNATGPYTRAANLELFVRQES